MAEKKTSRFDTLVPAILGVVGVVAGVLVTSGLTYLSDQNSRRDASREARRLVAAEIFKDTQKLVFASESGRLNSPQPTSQEWASEAPTLARYTNADAWEKVSSFYANLENTQHSLTRTCIGGANPRNDTRNEV